jgi:hypothetical protein
VEVLYLSKRTPKSKVRKYPSSRTSAALALHDKPAKKYGS